MCQVAYPRFYNSSHLERISCGCRASTPKAELSDFAPAHAPSSLAPRRPSSKLQPRAHDIHTMYVARRSILPNFLIGAVEASRTSRFVACLAQRPTYLAIHITHRVANKTCERAKSRESRNVEMPMSVLLGFTSPIRNRK